MSQPVSHRTRNARRTQGLTPVEVAAVISVLGMIVAVAIPTLARTIRVSKVSEASEQLDALYRATAAYYATPRPQPDGHSVYCMPQAAGPAPTYPSQSPVEVNFETLDTTGAPTWHALGFAPRTPLRYRYSFLPSRSGCWLEPPRDAVLVLRAEGDLDGDGVYSRFERRARIGARGALIADRVLHVQDRIE